jgi:hypothetical protein
MAGDRGGLTRGGGFDGHSLRVLALRPMIRDLQLIQRAKMVA